MCHTKLTLCIFTIVLSVTYAAYITGSGYHGTNETHARIDCPDNEDCTVNCEYPGSCIYTDIRCPDNYACTVLCSNGTGGNTCYYSSVTGINTTQLTIQCDAIWLYPTYQPTCGNMKVNVVGASKETSTVHINCTSNTYPDYPRYGICAGTQYLLNNFNSVSLDCSAYGTCYGSQFTFGHSKHVHIACSEEGDCFMANFIIEVADSVSITTNHGNSAPSGGLIQIHDLSGRFVMNCNSSQCRDSNFRFSGISDGVEINCNEYMDKSSCAGSVFEVGYDTQFTVNCHGYYSCDGIEIYGDCDMLNISCSSQCEAHQINNMAESGAYTFQFPALCPFHNTFVPTNATLRSTDAADVNKFMVIFIILVVVAVLTACGIVVVCWIRLIKLLKRSQKEVAMIIEKRDTDEKGDGLLEQIEGEVPLELN